MSNIKSCNAPLVNMRFVSPRWRGQHRRKAPASDEERASRGQGITAETSGVLMGGWQTDRESAYVALSRAKEQTQIYVSCEHLGEAGMGVGAIQRLSDRIRRRDVQEASVSCEVDGRPERESDRQRQLEQDRELDRGFGIE